MTSDRWQRIKAILEAVESAPVADRPTVLDHLCEGDADLRLEAATFLAEDDDAGTFIKGLIGAQAASLTKTTGRQQRFGHYQIVGRVGQGGMGAVYEAVRVDDFHRKVALKIIKQGLDSDFARTRFLQERQLLASLEHPYIARLLDGGESDDGSPYLVLEFVDGVPITQYSEALDQTAKLRLFLKVCEAVEHAHRNLVVHRDLKPANILITAHGDPKLLDFGIAKLLDPTASENPTTSIALSPDYASPEQIRDQPITTASDVYSLGVILYQLLTGRKPYTVGSATPLEMERIVAERPPAPPGLGDELDQILLMALRKEPERRYAGVQRFAEDIDRYLDHRPVSARPDTVRYRAKKFARRNWWQIASVAMVIASLGAGLAFSLAAQQRANRRFNEVRQLANQFLFDFHDEIKNTPGTVRAREMIVTTALKYLNSLARDAGSDPGLRWEMAVAYGKVSAAQGLSTAPSLGRPRDALASVQKALALARPLADAKLLTIEQRVVLNGLFCDAAELHRFLRENDVALKLLREADARTAGLPAAARVKALNETAITLNLMGDLLGSVGALERSLQISRDNAQRDPSPGNREELVAILAPLGTAQHRLTRFTEAMAAEVEALAILHGLAAERPDTPRMTRLVGRTLTRVGDVLGACDRPSMGKFAEAGDRYREALALTTKLIALDPNDVNSRADAGLLHNKIACSISDVDPHHAVEDAFLSAQLLDAAVPVGAQFRAQPRISEAGAYRTQGQYGAAERLLNEAAEVLPPSDINTRADLNLEWARLEAARGNSAGAASWFARAVDDSDALFRKTTTPFYAWNLVRALEFAAAAVPGSAPAFRERIAAIWTDQNRRFPGQPYIEQQLAEAKSHLAGQ